MILGQSAIANATLDAGMIDAAVMSDARPATADVTIQPQDGAQDERFLVFVNPPAEGATLTANDPSFVGAVQFFGGSHHPGEAGTFTLPLTPALRALQRAGRLRNSDPLRIEVVPDTEGAARRPLKAELKGVSVRAF
jgi:hypothetical protein